MQRREPGGAHGGAGAGLDQRGDDHPSHIKCPEFNQVGFLSPGQRRETGNFVTVQTCGFHDHLDAQNPDRLGTINIVE